MKLSCVVAVSALAWYVGFAADPVTESLQAGLLEEEVNRDLNAAVKAYEGAVKQADAQRQTAATALFRLAESYRKLGRTNDAVAQYRRILDQFGDQAVLAGLSRTNLGMLAPRVVPEGDASSGPNTPSELRLLAAQLAAIERLKADPEKQGHAMQAVFPDEGLNRMLWHLETLKRQATFARTNQAAGTLTFATAIGPEGSGLAQVGVELRPGEPAPFLDEQVADQLGRITQRVDFLLKTQQARLDALGVAVRLPAQNAPAAAADSAEVASLREEIKMVEQELLAAQKKLENGKAEATEVRRAQKELLELRRRLPENAARERQVALLEEELKLAEESLQEVRKRIEVGVAPPLDENPYRREILALQRELGAVQRAANAANSGTTGTGPEPGAAPATNEEVDAIQRIRAIIQNSPDLVNARNATSTGGTPLHKAAEQGYLAVAEFLLENGADVNATDGARQSPLHLAAAGGHKRLCELFLAKGADVKASDTRGQTPLFLAVERGYLAVAEVLLAAGAEVNTKASPGGAAEPQPGWESSPLHAAAEKGFSTLIELLLQHGAELNARDRGGRTPLIRAVLALQVAASRLLVERGADVNALDGDERTALAHAVAKQNLVLVQFLLDHKADLEVRVGSNNSDYGWTVLFEPVGLGRVELSQLLLDRGANVNAEGATGIRPVHWAVIQNAPATLKLLLERKADLNVRDTGGNTPLHYAVETANVGNVETLLAAGADPNAAGWNEGQERNWPPLLRAITADSKRWTVDLASALVKGGADVNHKLTQGWTALHRAAKLDRTDLAQLLVEQGAELNARGSRPAGDPILGERMPVAASLPPAGSESRGSAGAGSIHAIRVVPPSGVLPAPGFGVATISGIPGIEAWPADRDVTPLHVAVANQNLPLAGFLLDHGANVNVGDADGRTPLHFAVNRRDIDLVRLLLDAQADPNARDASGETPWTIMARVSDQAVIYGTSRPGRGVVVSAKPSEIVALLRQRGAKTVVSDPNAIIVTRPATGFSAKVLTRASRDWNHFTVLELLAIHYGLLAQSGVEQGAGRAPRPGIGARPSNDPLAFPDLARIRIARPQPGVGEKWIPVDLSAALKAGDCAADLALEWGDLVEVPEEDHPLDAVWDLSDALRVVFKKCLERRVVIVVKGEPTTYGLTLPYERSSDDKSWVVDGRPQRYGWDVATILARSSLLRTSSDRSAILVKRVDSATGTRREWRVDCSPGSQESDLWLRDGDVIEVPDRP